MKKKKHFYWRFLLIILTGRVNKNSFFILHSICKKKKKALEFDDMFSITKHALPPHIPKIIRINNDKRLVSIKIKTGTQRAGTSASHGPADYR